MRSPARNSFVANNPKCPVDDALTTTDDDNDEDDAISCFGKVVTEHEEDLVDDEWMDVDADDDWQGAQNSFLRSRRQLF
jgi:hypothetical protein